MRQRGNIKIALWYYCRLTRKLRHRRYYDVALVQFYNLDVTITNAIINMIDFRFRSIFLKYGRYIHGNVLILFTHVFYVYVYHLYAGEFSG